MKVLILNEDLGLGGVESMSVELANTLSDEENYGIFVASAEGPLINRLNPKIRHFHIPKFNLYNTLQLKSELTKIIADVNPDIIHSQGATISLLASIAKKNASAKSINILTRHSRKVEKLPNFLGNYLMKKHCDHIIAISRSTYDAFLGWGYPSDKVSLIPNFVDYENIRNTIESYNRKSTLQALGIDEDSYIVTMVGRLIPAKKFDKFIEIVEKASENLDKNLVGLVIGDGVARKDLEAQAKALSGKARIMFLGYRDNIFEYLNISNIFLFPSEHPEVLPMALIEALAAGVPIICSAIPGNKDIIDDGYNGFIIDGPVDAYVKSLTTLLEDKERATTISANAVTTAKDTYDRLAVAHSVMRLYEKLTNGHRPS